MHSSNSDHVRSSGQGKGKESQVSLNDKSVSSKDNKDKEQEIEKSPDIMWLNYETRLRKLMQELLTPTVKRSREDRELFDKLKHQCELLTKRVEELEVVTHKTENKQTIFDDIFSKINKLDTVRKSENIELAERIKKIEDETTSVTHDYNHLRDSLKDMNDLTQRISEDFTKTTLQLDEYKKTFSNMVNDLQKNVNDEATKRKEESIKIEEKFQATNNNILELRTNMNAHDIVMQTTKTVLNDLTAKVAGFETEVNECNDSIANFSKYIDSIKFLKLKTEQFELRARTTESYLERYLPIFIQAQISETLHHCLPSSNKRKLYYYEEKKFRDLNNDVLHDDGNPDLQKRIQSMYSILEATVKRYSKSMAANALGLRSRESETGKQTESSLSRFAKGQKGSTFGAGLSDRMKQITSDDKSDITGRPNAVPSSMDEKIDEIEVPMSSRHGSVVLEDEAKKKGNEADGDKSSSLARLSARLDEKDDKVIFENQALEQAGDEASDIDSDLDQKQTRDIKVMQEDIAAIKAAHDFTYKRLYNEMNERLARISQEQLEIAENATVSVRNIMLDIERFIKDKQKGELEKNVEFDGLTENVKRNSETHEKYFQFLKKINEIIVPLIETVNGLLALSLKQEKEKKSLVGMLQTNITHKGPEETFKRKADAQKKLLDLPYLAGSKIGAPTEERDDASDYEIKLSFNGKVVRAVEFLELTFENFRNCLNYSTKFRVSSNFAQFLESETAKPPVNPRNSLRAAKGAPHLLYDEKGSERAVSAGLKPPFSRVGTLTYKNYVSENANTRILDRRRSPAGLLVKDKDDLNVNKSFH